MKRKRAVCKECKEEKDNCRAISFQLDASIVYVCPGCIEALDYDKFLHPPKGNKS